MVAWKLEKVDTCPRCGVRYEEWDEDPNAYEASSRRCVGCEKIEWEQSSWAEEKNSKGIQVSLVRPEDLQAPKIPIAYQGSGGDAAN